MIAPLGGPGTPAPGFPRRLTYAAVALRQPRKLPRTDAGAIVATLETYAATGVGDVRQLTNVRPPAFRLRVGEFRAVFHLANAAVEIRWVGNRRDAY